MSDAWRKVTLWLAVMAPMMTAGAGCILIITTGNFGGRLSYALILSGSLLFAATMPAYFLSMMGGLVPPPGAVKMFGIRGEPLHADDGTGEVESSGGESIPVRPPGGG